MLLACAGAGGAAGGVTYVDDVFSTFLYDGSSGSQTITNGIDLDGEGGLVWVKSRANAENHAWFDSERGATKFLRSDSTDPEYTISNVSFTSSGFSYNTASGEINESGQNYCSWTFRKASGFFDVVTYTGNGTAGRTVSHSLGSTPGAIFIKKVNNTENWIVYHRSVGATKYLKLNETGAAATSSVIFNNTEPTSTEFTLGLNSQVNENGDTYVAYVFAHDDQSFGTGSDEAIIKCGTYTGNSVSDSSTQDISVGFEPQWVLVKKTSGTADWVLIDNMRGERSLLYPADSKIEDTSNSNFKLITPDGFRLGASSDVNENSGTFIYIAIRRPHKPPEAGTDVFKAVTYSGSSGAQTVSGAGFAPDYMWSKDRSLSNNGWHHDRLRGVYSLDSSATGGEQDRSSYIEVLGQDGVKFTTGGFDLNRNGSNHIAQFFKRAPGFFDVVCYDGSGSTKTVAHNLGATPQLIIFKNRSSSARWRVYNSVNGPTGAMSLNENFAFSTGVSSGYFNDTAPTSTQFTVATNTGVNGSGSEYVAYLFATLDGISKVGSYSGTGNNIDVDCGFTAGARYVLIKRTDSTGDWYVWDTARGIATGNDPYLLLNTTAAEVTSTDYIDPLNSGFTVTSSAPAALNSSGGTYLFLAIA